MRILSFLPALIIISIIIYFIVKFRATKTYISKPTIGIPRKLNISVFQIIVITLLLIITGIISFVFIAVILKK